MSELLGLDINVVIGTAIAVLIMQLLRKLHRSKFWSEVFSNARHKLQAPDVPIDDPDKAAEVALLEAHAPQLQKIKRALRESLQPVTSEVGPDDATPRMMRAVKPPDEP